MRRGKELSTAAMVLYLASAAAFGLQQGEEQVGATTWTRVQYLGGAVGVIGKAENWDNTLTIGPDKIEMVAKGKPLFSIEPKSVVAITYAGIRTERPQDAWQPLTLAPAVPGTGVLALIRLARSRSKDHLVALEYMNSEATHAGILLRLHKGNHKKIIEALRNTTGVVQPGDAIKR